METSVFLAVGIVIVQALDLVGHAINHRKLKELKAEVRANVKDAKADRDAIFARVDELAKKLETVPDQGVAELANGLDAHELSSRGVAAREAKAAQRALQVTKVRAALGEWYEYAKASFPEAVELAEKNPKLAEMALTPVRTAIEDAVRKGMERARSGGARDDGGYRPAGSDY